MLSVIELKEPRPEIQAKFANTLTYMLQEYGNRDKILIQTPYQSYVQLIIDTFFRFGYICEIYEITSNNNIEYHELGFYKER